MAATQNARCNSTTFIRDELAWAYRKQLRRALLGSVASLIVSAEPSPVLAQGVYSAPPAPPPADSGATQLPAISVEGAEKSTEGGYKADQPSLGKLTEPLLNTPFTIETVTRQLMNDQGVTTLRDALRNVPGISLAAGEAAAQGDSLTIRGFTARSDIFLDGLRDFGSYYRDPFYLQDIQVLKGPASILFGRGSTGGVVEQDSKLPTLSPFVTGTLVYGSDLTARATADVNQPLPEWGEGAALRLNLMVNRNNISDRDIAQYKRFGIAPSLVFGLGTPNRLTFTYLHLQEYNQPDYGLPWLYIGRPGTQTAIGIGASLAQTQSNYYGFEDGNYLCTNVNIPTIKFEHDFNKDLTLTNQLRYASYDRAFFITEPQIYTQASALTPGGTGTFMLIPPNTPLSSLLVSRNQLAGSSSETYLVDDLDVTTRFSTGFMGHTLRAGIELSRETSNPIRYTTIGPYSQTPLLAPNPFDTFNASTYLSTSTKTTAYTQAAYALDTIQLDPQWQIMGGLRFDRFAADFRQLAFANPITGAGAAGSVFDHIDRELSWRTALIYKPLPNGSIYFDAGNSYDPSAEALSLSLATAPLPPVENITYEVGTKWELIDGGLAINASLFRTEQLNVREPDPTNPLFNILAGNAVAKGGEIVVAGNITERWQVLAGYAYTFAEITESPTVGPTSDLGHRLANVPANTANLWTTYRLPGNIEVGGGFNLVSSRFAATTPSVAGGVPFFKFAPGYWTMQAMAKFPITENVALQCNLYNLTGTQFYDLLHPAHVVPGNGPTALFTLSFRY
jgi:catecholate siderophore receptor